MTKQVGLKREFNRLYGNLIELCIRIYDEEGKYPKTTCAIWFVDELGTIMTNDNLKALLQDSTVVLILEMCSNIRKSQYLDNSNKKLLSGYINELKTIKSNLNEKVAF